MLVNKKVRVSRVKTGDIIHLSDYDCTGIVLQVINRAPSDKIWLKFLALELSFVIETHGYAKNHLVVRLE